VYTQSYTIGIETGFSWQNIRENRRKFFIRCGPLLSISLECWGNIFIGISIIIL